jgi:hypothetical protein
LCHLIKKSSSDDLRLRTLESNGERLRVFEQKILRKIIGPLKTSDEQYEIHESRYNQELYQIYQGPDIAATVQHRRLLQDGHVERRDENRPVYETFNGKF